MLVKVKINGFIQLDLPPGTIYEEVAKQEWLNRFSLWVKDAQEELQVPEFEDKEAFVEDVDLLLQD